jgi:hypothetical protein
MGQAELIPANLGCVEKITAGKNGRVFLIQDLHCNYEVQAHIAGLLDHLARQEGLTLVGLEGASQPVNVTYLSTFPKPDIKRQAGLSFMREGKLSGAEFCAATGDRPLHLRGIENPSLYETSRKMLPAFLNDEVQGTIFDLREQLAALKPGIYSEPLQDLDRATQAYREGNIPLVKYQAELCAGAQKLNVALSDYPEVLAYMARKTVGVNPDQVTEQTDNLDRALRERLYTRAEQRQLDGLWQHLAVLERALNISATPAEVRACQTHPAEYATARFSEFFQQQGEGDTPDTDYAALDQSFRSALKFYALAEQRSLAFADNLANQMRMNHTALAAAVVGGFHGERLQAELAQRGIGCVVVRPALTHADLANPYFALLRNRKTPLEKLLAQNQNIFGLPPALPETSAEESILSPLQERALPPENRVFKHWLRLRLHILDLMGLKEAGVSSKTDLKSAHAADLAAYPYETTPPAGCTYVADDTLIMPFPGEKVSAVIQSTKLETPGLKQALERLTSSKGDYESHLLPEAEALALQAQLATAPTTARRLHAFALWEWPAVFLECSAILWGVPNAGWTARYSPKTNALRALNRESREIGHALALAYGALTGTPGMMTLKNALMHADKGNATEILKFYYTQIYRWAENLKQTQGFEKLEKFVTAMFAGQKLEAVDLETYASGSQTAQQLREKLKNFLEKAAAVRAKAPYKSLQTVKKIKSISPNIPIKILTGGKTPVASNPIDPNIDLKQLGVFNLNGTIYIVREVYDRLANQGGQETLALVCLHEALETANMTHLSVTQIIYDALQVSNAELIKQVAAVNPHLPTGRPAWQHAAWTADKINHGQEITTRQQAAKQALEQAAQSMQRQEEPGGIYHPTAEDVEKFSGSFGKKKLAPSLELAKDFIRLRYRRNAQWDKQAANALQQAVKALGEKFRLALILEPENFSAFEKTRQAWLNSDMSLEEWAANWANDRLPPWQKLTQLASHDFNRLTPLLAPFLKKQWKVHSWPELVRYARQNAGALNTAQNQPVREAYALATGMARILGYTSFETILALQGWLPEEEIPASQGAPLSHSAIILDTLAQIGAGLTYPELIALVKNPQEMDLLLPEERRDLLNLANDLAWLEDPQTNPHTLTPGVQETLSQFATLLGYPADNKSPNPKQPWQKLAAQMKKTPSGNTASPIQNMLKNNVRAIFGALTGKPGYELLKKALLQQADQESAAEITAIRKTPFNRIYLWVENLKQAEQGLEKLEKFVTAMFAGQKLKAIDLETYTPDSKETLPLRENLRKLLDEAAAVRAKSPQVFPKIKNISPNIPIKILTGGKIPVDSNIDLKQLGVFNLNGTIYIIQEIYDRLMKDDPVTLALVCLHEALETTDMTHLSVTQILYDAFGVSNPKLIERVAAVNPYVPRQARAAGPQAPLSKKTEPASSDLNLEKKSQPQPGAPPQPVSAALPAALKKPLQTVAENRHLPARPLKNAMPNVLEEKRNEWFRSSSSALWTAVDRLQPEIKAPFNLPEEDEETFQKTQDSWLASGIKLEDWADQWARKQLPRWRPEARLREWKAQSANTLRQAARDLQAKIKSPLVLEPNNLEAFEKTRLAWLASDQLLADWAADWINTLLPQGQGQNLQVEKQRQEQEKQNALDRRLHQWSNSITTALQSAAQGYPLAENRTYQVRELDFEFFKDFLRQEITAGTAEADLPALAKRFLTQRIQTQARDSRRRQLQAPQALAAALEQVFPGQNRNSAGLLPGFLAAMSEGSDVGAEALKFALMQKSREEQLAAQQPPALPEESKSMAASTPKSKFADKNQAPALPPPSDALAPKAAKPADSSETPVNTIYVAGQGLFEVSRDFWLNLIKPNINILPQVTNTVLLRVFKEEGIPENSRAAKEIRRKFGIYLKYAEWPKVHSRSNGHQAHESEIPSESAGREADQAEEIKPAAAEPVKLPETLLASLPKDLPPDLAQELVRLAKTAVRQWMISQTAQVQTHRLPIYLWQPFRTRLEAAYKNHIIDQPAYDRLLSGQGVMRVIDGRILAEDDQVLGLLASTLSEELNRPISPEQVRGYLLFHEQAHLAVQRMGAGWLSRLDGKLQNPALYTGTPITGYAQLQAFFANNYGVFNVEELLAVFHTEQTKLGQDVRLVQNKTQPEMRIALPPQVKAVLQQAVSQIPAEPLREQETAGLPETAAQFIKRALTEGALATFGALTGKPGMIVLKNALMFNDQENTTGISAVPYHRLHSWSEKAKQAGHDPEEIITVMFKHQSLETVDLETYTPDLEKTQQLRGQLKNLLNKTAALRAKSPSVSEKLKSISPNVPIKILTGGKIPLAATIDLKQLGAFNLNGTIYIIQEVYDRLLQADRETLALVCLHEALETTDMTHLSVTQTIWDALQVSNVELIRRVAAVNPHIRPIAGDSPPQVLAQNPISQEQKKEPEQASAGENSRLLDWDQHWKFALQTALGSLERRIQTTAPYLLTKVQADFSETKEQWTSSGLDLTDWATQWVNAQYPHWRESEWNRYWKNELQKAALRRQKEINSPCRLSAWELAAFQTTKNDWLNSNDSLATWVARQVNKYFPDPRGLDWDQHWETALQAAVNTLQIKAGLTFELQPQDLAEFQATRGAWLLSSNKLDAWADAWLQQHFPRWWIRVRQLTARSKLAASQRLSNQDNTAATSPVLPAPILEKTKPNAVLETGEKSRQQLWEEQAANTLRQVVAAVEEKHKLSLILEPEDFTAFNKTQQAWLDSNMSIKGWAENWANNLLPQWQEQARSRDSKQQETTAAKQNKKAQRLAALTQKPQTQPGVPPHQVSANPAAAQKKPSQTLAENNPSPAPQPKNAGSNISEEKRTEWARLSRSALWTAVDRVQPELKAPFSLSQEDEENFQATMHSWMASDKRLTDWAVDFVNTLLLPRQEPGQKKSNTLTPPSQPLPQNPGTTVVKPVGLTPHQPSEKPAAPATLAGAPLKPAEKLPASVKPAETAPQPSENLAAWTKLAKPALEKANHEILADRGRMLTKITPENAAEFVAYLGKVTDPNADLSQLATSFLLKKLGISPQPVNQGDKQAVKTSPEPKNLPGNGTNSALIRNNIFGFSPEVWKKFVTPKINVAPEVREAVLFQVLKERKISADSSVTAAIRRKYELYLKYAELPDPTSSKSVTLPEAWLATLPPDLSPGLAGELYRLAKLAADEILTPHHGLSRSERAQAEQAQLAAALLEENHKTHRLPLYLWQPFQARLEDAYKNHVINPEAYARLLSGQGVMRVSEGRILTEDNQVLGLLAGTLSEQLRRPISVDQVRAYLLFHEQTHLAVQRLGAGWLNQFRGRLRNPVLYAGTPVAGYAQLQEFFANNYGVFNEEELLVVFQTEHTMLNQDVRLVPDKTQPQARMPLPPQVKTILQQAVAQIRVDVSGDQISAQPVMAEEPLDLQALQRFRAILPEPVNESGRTWQSLPVKMVQFALRLELWENRRQAWPVGRILRGLQSVLWMGMTLLQAVFSAAMTAPAAEAAKAVENAPYLAALKQALCLPDAVMARTFQIRQIQFRPLSERGGFWQRALRREFLSAYAEGSAEKGTWATIYLPDQLLLELERASVSEKTQALFPRWRRQAAEVLVAALAENEAEVYFSQAGTTAPVRAQSPEPSAEFAAGQPLAEWYLGVHKPVALSPAEIGRLLGQYLQEAATLTSADASLSAIHRQVGQKIEKGAAPALATVMGTLENASLPAGSLAAMWQALARETEILGGQDADTKQALIKCGVLNELLRPAGQPGSAGREPVSLPEQRSEQISLLAMPRTYQLQMALVQNALAQLSNQPGATGLVNRLRNLQALLKEAAGWKTPGEAKRLSPAAGAFLLGELAYTSSTAGAVLMPLGEDFSQNMHGAASGRVETASVNGLDMARPLIYEISAPLSWVPDADTLTRLQLPEAVKAAHYNGAVEKQLAWPRAWGGPLVTAIMGGASRLPWRRGQWLGLRQAARARLESAWGFLSPEAQTSELGQLFFQTGQPVMDSPVLQAYLRFAAQPENPALELGFVKSVLRALKNQDRRAENDPQKFRALEYSLEAFSELAGHFPALRPTAIGHWHRLARQPQGAQVWAPECLAGDLLGALESFRQHQGYHGPAGAYEDLLNLFPDSVDLEPTKLERMRRKLFYSAANAA